MSRPIELVRNTYASGRVQYKIQHPSYHYLELSSYTGDPYRRLEPIKVIYTTTIESIARAKMQHFNNQMLDEELVSSTSLDTVNLTVDNCNMVAGRVSHTLKF